MNCVGYRNSNGGQGGAVGFVRCARTAVHIVQKNKDTWWFGWTGLVSCAFALVELCGAVHLCSTFLLLGVCGERALLCLHLASDEDYLSSTASVMLSGFWFVVGLC